ncbi:unnamed protein product, partial [Polarella glacialis]
DFFAKAKADREARGKAAAAPPSADDAAEDFFARARASREAAADEKPAGKERPDEAEVRNIYAKRKMEDGEDGAQGFFLKAKAERDVAKDSGAFQEQPSDADTGAEDFFARSRAARTAAAAAASAPADGEAPAAPAAAPAEPEVEVKRPFLKLVVESCTMQGRRPKQEDRHVKVADLTKAAKALKMPIDHLEQPCGYFSVFDGHQGDQCSGYISKNFHVKLLKRLSADTDTASWTDERFSSCLTEICEELDTEFLAKFRTALDGSTLVVALITGQRIFTAW